MQLEPIDILKKYWGYSEFRPMQEDIIQAVMDDRDTLALLPTGGGKSICFQVPALALDGMCIVISPLIALMKDQVEQLKKRKIPAAALYSGMTHRELDIVLDNCAYGNYKFLYVSPERLQTELFQERIKKIEISMVAIDEAHCISQWGYDFRPPYLEIAAFLEGLGSVKKIALTATATSQVKEDIINKLEFTDTAIFQKSFSRKNLSYSAFQLNNKMPKVLEILRNVPGSSVIYVRSRKRTREVATMLWQNQIPADFYHAGLNGEERSAKQDAWIQNKTRVIVSTNAFGMGIDKPDVRTVIHLDIPDTLEAYYQEAGRAGRDEKMAYAVLLYDVGDIESIRRWAEQSAVGIDLMKRVYQSLANHLKLAVGSHTLASFEFDINELVDVFNLPGLETHFALKKLEEVGLIQLSDNFKKYSNINIIISREELYKFQVANANIDPIIKTLLRLYGGELFTNFVRVREIDIAKLLNTSVEDIQKKLKYLHQTEIIAYDYPTNHPKITFLTPRQDANKLSIDLRKLEFRNKLSHDKVEAMIDYIENTHRCRTQQLQEYFDEVSYLNCGVCDYCIKLRKEGNNIAEIEGYKKLIIEKLNQNYISIDDAIEKFQIADRQLFTSALRELMEENKVLFLEGRIAIG